VAGAEFERSDQAMSKLRIATGGTVLAALILLCCLLWAKSDRGPVQDSNQITMLEQEWLHAKDAATLDRILAPDFIHVLPMDHFLTKQEQIEWFEKHPKPPNRSAKFDKLNIRFYGDAAVVNGSVIASDENGKELERSMFTDVFIYRNGRWQAVNAQENVVNPEGK
jgi:hypothetical protein